MNDIFFYRCKQKKCLKLVCGEKGAMQHLRRSHKKTIANDQVGKYFELETNPPTEEKKALLKKRESMKKYYKKRTKKPQNTKNTPTEPLFIPERPPRVTLVKTVDSQVIDDGILVTVQYKIPNEYISTVIIPTLP